MSKRIENTKFVFNRYGFQEAVTPHDIMHWNSSSWPHSNPTSDLSILTSVSFCMDLISSN
jgi:hypothetical protein